MSSKDPEKRRAAAAKFKADNPTYFRDYARAHPEKGRANKLKTRYGMTVAEYDAMHDAQGGVCALCNQVCQTGKRLCVDHYHDTNVNRGLLCRKCNARVHDHTLETLEMTAAYLRGWTHVRGSAA